MLTKLREKNKATIWRVIFKWAFLITSCTYFAALLVGHVISEYTEVKSMMQDEDKERLRYDEMQYEKTMYKIIPDFLSYWNYLWAILLIGAAASLFKI